MKKNYRQHEKKLGKALFIGCFFLHKWEEYA